MGDGSWVALGFPDNGTSGEISKVGFKVMKEERGKCQIWRKKDGINESEFRRKVREAMNSKASYSLRVNNCIHFALHLLGLLDFYSQLVSTNPLDMAMAEQVPLPGPSSRPDLVPPAHGPSAEGTAVGTAVGTVVGQQWGQGWRQPNAPRMNNILLQVETHNEGGSCSGWSVSIPSVNSPHQGCGSPKGLVSPRGLMSPAELWFPEEWGLLQGWGRLGGLWGPGRAESPVGLESPKRVGIPWEDRRVLGKQGAQEG